MNSPQKRTKQRTLRSKDVKIRTPPEVLGFPPAQSFLGADGRRVNTYACAGRNCKQIRDVTAELRVATPRGVAVMASDTKTAPPPALGSLVPSGSRVIVVVSRGPMPEAPTGFADMPDVVGIVQGDALSRLQEVGLAAQVFNDYSETVVRGHVMGQLPPRGNSAPVGTEAVLMVSSGPAASHTSAVALPSVVGLSEADAVARLRTGGLTPQIVRDFHPGIAAGLVADQLPNTLSLAELPNKRVSSAWIWLVTALVLAAAIGGAFWYFNRPSTVPNVVGLTQAQAQGAISSAGFSVGSVGTTQTVGAADVGNVVTQTPVSETTARRGSAIDIVVSGGQALIDVPSVVGSNQPDAEKTLKDAGFRPSASQSYSTTVDKGLVIAQTPVAGQRVPAGTTIGITVSQGVANVIVPGLVGVPQGVAQDALKTAGLMVQSESNFDTSTPSGQVSSQLPIAGVSVAPGTIVGMVVSKGTPPSGTLGITIPNVTGQTSAKAQSILGNTGLSAVLVEWNGSGQRKGVVVGQIASPGVTAPKGSTVIVFVSSGA